MNKAVRIYILFILLTLSHFLFGQSSFTIKYYFKLFKENGEVLSRKDYLNNKICIDASAGTLNKFGYNSNTKYFFVEIHTTWPVFTIIWKQKNQQMRICINHATKNKEIYLDSICFKPGAFFISGDLNKYITFEDKFKLHLLFQDISEYKLPSEASIERYRSKTIKCW